MKINEAVDLLRTSDDTLMCVCLRELCLTKRLYNYYCSRMFLGVGRHPSSTVAEHEWLLCIEVLFILYMRTGLFF